MKTYLKILVALIVIAATLAWAVSSAWSHSYSGTDLEFAIGEGAVTVTNPAQTSVSVQLVSPATSSFSVVSSVAGAAGSSALQGTGPSARQLFPLELPSGVSQFTVTRGSNVSFMTNATTQLDVDVQPLTQSNTQITIVATAIVILAALYYVSKTTGHRWIARLRGQAFSAPVVKPFIAPVRDTPIRSYGDNRADISER